jgi:16S rRNA methyltransferase gidB
MNIEVFKKEVEKLGISLTDEKLNQLALFYQLLLSWNEKMNLTRITNQEEVYLKHFYDSLTLYKEIKLETVDTLCDVGSGAGFPGIVLKIVFPNLDITLIDSLQKRVNYLNEIIKELKLSNIRAIHTRCEDYARVNREKYEVVTARAVANLKVLSELCLPLVKENGYFIAMKGKATEELDEAKAMIGTLGGKIEHINEFSLPLEESNRTLIKIKKEKKTDKIYPRKKIK